MTTLETSAEPRAVSEPDGGEDASASGLPVVLSFDVEEHHRIEAAAGLDVEEPRRELYRERMERVTDWILEQLASRDIRATFFIVGQIAVSNARLVRSIHEAGHEVASHGWDHRRIHVMSPEGFREDIRTSRDALEYACGAAVMGYRAPTFSMVRKTGWAIDVLAELGLAYDSSIYPVHHDRYGVPDAPRGPFLARGIEREILEIPPATLRVAGVNVPVGGGGYFRLLPLPLLRLALGRSRKDPACGATVLYFHPWEFDPGQPRLALKPLSRFRTYVGIRRSRDRLSRLMEGYRFQRAIDVARAFAGRRDSLVRFRVAT